MKLLWMWILMIVAIGATGLQHDGIYLQFDSIRLQQSGICLQYDSICQVALGEDTAQVTCIFSKDVYQEKVAFNVQMFAANSVDPSTVAACVWDAGDSLKPECMPFPGIHLNESITNVVAITVPTDRLPVGGGRFMCQMVNQARNDFLPCSWTDPEPQTTATPGISSMSTSTEEELARTDSHRWSLAIAFSILGTVVMTVPLYSLILGIVRRKGWLCWKHRTRKERTTTAVPEGNGEPLSTVDDEV